MKTLVVIVVSAVLGFGGGVVGSFVLSHAGPRGQQGLSIVGPVGPHGLRGAQGVQGLPGSGTSGVGPYTTVCNQVFNNTFGGSETYYFPCTPFVTPG
jgi:hypothetical protein